jgi:signal transduction histidine kinase
LLLALGPRSLLAVPLVARVAPLGSLTWLRIASAQAYSAEDLGLAEDVAARTGVAMRRRATLPPGRAGTGRGGDANQAKDEFLRVLSHELRTPLTSMLGWLRLLARGSSTGTRSPSPGGGGAEHAHAGAAHNDLLDVSRIITGKLELDLYPVEMAPIVDEAVQSARRGAERRGWRSS